MKPYTKRNIPLAKELRKNMTPWERKLWYEYLRFYPIRFQRQKAIGDYIADFYCAKARLVIELDGGGHYEPLQLQEDMVRTVALNNMGLRVLRICNKEIDDNFRGVCEYIDQNVQNSLPQSAAPTAPSSEGALDRVMNQKKIFALGFFDGVHLGHQALLDACERMARELGITPGVVTFIGHPDTLVAGKTPPLINTAADRERLLRGYGMEQVEMLIFDRALMKTPWEAFFAMLLQKGAAGLVCGEDFRFGHKGAGTAEKLRCACEGAGIPCTVVPDRTLDGIRISSSHIRTLLETGKMEEANRFLGHPHILTGEVVHGRQLGRTIGIPTANLQLPQGLLVPIFGVYACRVRVEGKIYMAVTNIGTRPTVEGHHVTVEPWLLDFEGDLYGKTLTLEFHAFLRPERKFDSLDALKAQIHHDAAQTRGLLG